MNSSVVVPAHNDELLLPVALRAIAGAAARVDGSVEVVVVANRCHDATAEIARAASSGVGRECFPSAGRPASTPPTR